MKLQDYGLQKSKYLHLGKKILFILIVVVASLLQTACSPEAVSNSSSSAAVDDVGEVQYLRTDKISVGFLVSSTKANRLVFISTDDSDQFIKTRTPFTENRFMGELIYKLK